MRDTTYTQALIPTRDIGARLTFTDLRLRFSYIPVSEAPADYLMSDSCDFGSGYLLCAVPASDNTVIHYRYATDAVWSILAVGTAIYHMAVEGGRIFVTTAAGYQHADYQAGAGFGAWTSVANATLANSLVAPVSTTEVYFLYYFIAGGKPFSYGRFYQVLNNNAPLLLPFRIYDTAAPAKIFDAVSLGGSVYLFCSEESGRRAAYFKHSGSWSEKKYVIPIDVIDDVSQFRFSSANVINGKLVVTGALYRSWGTPMHIYTFGPERYSLGRDMFIGTQVITGNGKLHLYDGKAIYVGTGIRYEAPVTSLLGYDNGDLTYQTEAVGNIRLSAASNQPYTLTLDLKHSTVHPSIRPGSLVKFEAKINGEYSDIGTYSIDAIVHPTDENGQMLSLALRSRAMKELATWESDAPYDYWSQTKSSSNPKDMAKVIRATGQWKEENGALTTYDLNKDCILYTSEKACHNGAMRAKFKRMAGDFMMRIGVGVNYYIETKAEAAERLGKELNDVVETDYGQNGIFAIFGKKEHNGSHGVELYALNQNVWTKLASAGIVLNDEVDYQVELLFRDGLCQVRYYGDEYSTSWPVALEYTIESNDFLPWKADYMGRGAIIVRTETASSVCRKIMGNYIIVDDASAFPASDQLLLDEEIISYSGKSNSPETPGSGTLSLAKVGSNVNPVWFIGKSHYGTGISLANLGNSDTSSKLRQKLTGETVGTVGCISAGIWPVGKPIDGVRVSIMNSSMKAKASVVVPASEMVAGQPLMIPFPKTTIATTDMIVFERTGALDPNNYYQVDTYNVYGSGVKYEYYDARLGWTSPAANIAILLEWYAPVPSTVALFGDGGVGYNNAASGYYTNCVVKFNPYPYGTKLSDLWTIVNDYTAANSFKLSQIPPSQHKRPCMMYPTLTVVARGANGTTQVEHSENTLAYVFREGPFVSISAVEYFSSEMDLTLEDMVAEIAGKAGIKTVESSLLYPASVIPSASNPSIQRKNVIVKFRRTSLSGTVILEARKDGPNGTGMQLRFDGSYIYFGGQGYDTSNAFNRIVPDLLPVNTDIIVSFFDELQFDADLNPAGYLVYVSLWIDGVYIHTFVASDTGTGEYFQIKGTSAQPITVYLTEACMRVDNFILDEGQKGAALIEQLIGEKRFFYQDHGDGIRLFRTRDEVNAGAPYRLAVSHSDADSDVNLATRVRVEGSDVKEVIDEELMAEHGNLFRLVHMNEINSPSDAAYYAGVALDEFGSRYYNQILSGAADPRIEPNDVIYCEFPEGVKKAIIDSVDFDLNVSETDATFDMSISGRVPRSEL